MKIRIIFETWWTEKKRVNYLKIYNPASENSVPWQESWVRPMFTTPPPTVNVSFSKHTFTSPLHHIFQCITTHVYMSNSMSDQLLNNHTWTHPAHGHSQNGLRQNDWGVVCQSLHSEVLFLKQHFNPSSSLKHFYVNLALEHTNKWITFMFHVSLK